MYFLEEDLLLKGGGNGPSVLDQFCARVRYDNGRVGSLCSARFPASPLVGGRARSEALGLLVLPICTPRWFKDISVLRPAFFVDTHSA
jgi:hypothetical protein